MATGEDRIIATLENITINITPVIALYIAASYALSRYSIYIALISLFGVVLIFIMEGFFQNKMRPQWRISKDNNLIQYKVSREALDHLSLIKSLSVENKFIKDFIAKRELNMLFNMSLDRKEEIYHGIRNYTMVGINLIAMYFTLQYYMSGDIQLGTIFVVFGIINQVLNNARNLQLYISRLAFNYIDIERYLDLIDLEPEFDENGKKKFKTGDITIQNLNFKYPKTDDYVLKDINLIIREGQKVAFVGHSGSGKTTIVKLLMRAYDYVGISPLPLREGLGVGVDSKSSLEGEVRRGPEPSIKIGGLELREINSHDLRSHIGYVEQHVDLFDATVRDNILMSVDEKTLSKWSKTRPNSPLPHNDEATRSSYIDEKLEEVAKQSRIDEFYHRLGEKKFDTEIGERGIKLSGGERQRVGIARAIIKNPSILILDEATSALDTVNEKYIKEAIDNVSRGRTTIIIAHRLSTVEDADMIIVMDRGHIVATGTHTELLSNSSHYQELVKAQLQQ